MKQSLLFITKNYPPAIGGMENYCRDLVKYLRKSGVDVTLIANGKGKYYLPWFGVKALFQGVFCGFKNDAIWIGDGSISFFGWLIATITGKPRYVTIHALDITRNKKRYQALIPRFVRRANHIVCVSEYTKQECIQRGIPQEKITVIPNGIDPELMPEVTISKQDLMDTFSIQKNQYEGKKILFSIGRHIERKGIHTFLEEIMPSLGEEYIYIIAGSGPYTQTYKEIIASKGLTHVYLIGRIDDDHKFAFYHHSDRFVMPNIKVEGDTEGFGIVCIEAGWYGCPVITTGIEGIADAVVDGESGVIVSNGQLNVWESSLSLITLDSKEVKGIVSQVYSWLDVIKKYLEIIK